MLLKTSVAALLLGLVPGLRLESTNAEENHSFRTTAAVGDHCVRGIRMEMRFRTTDMPRSPQGWPDVQFRISEEWSYTERVLAIDSEGDPTTVRRCYSHARKKSGPGLALFENIKSPLEGRTIVLSREGNETTITSGGEGLSNFDRAKFKDALAKPKPPIIPVFDASPGEEWTLDAAFSPLPRTFSGKATIKFLGVRAYRSRPCAQFLSQATFATKNERGVEDISGRLSGDAFFATDLRKPLTITLSGPLSIKQWGDDPTVTGQGTIQVSHETTWLAIGGQPVSKAKLTRR